MNKVTEDYLYILNELRRKLHDPRGPKAAVMVGSGFSLNATPRLERNLGTEHLFGCLASFGTVEPSPEATASGELQPSSK